MKFEKLIEFLKSTHAEYIELYNITPWLTDEELRKDYRHIKFNLKDFTAFINSYDISKHNGNYYNCTSRPILIDDNLKELLEKEMLSKSIKIIKDLITFEEAVEREDKVQNRLVLELSKF